MIELLITAAAAATVAYIFGWLLGKTEGHRLSENARGYWLRERQQREQLAEWVMHNWPDEYAAYHQGHEEGYQQGVTQGPDLE
jgi:hypothetical protein